MTLVIEDGTGLADATSFASRAELIAFAAARGITLADSDATDVNLVLAMDYLATRDFVGEPVVATQGTPFPRTLYVNAVSEDLVFPNDSVPAAIKRAQLMLALASSQGVKLLDQRSAGRELKSRDVGPLKRTYADSSLSHAEIAGLAELLTPFMVAEGSFSLSVVRA